MNTIDCSIAPTALTDFAFDHLTDDYPDATLDYDNQTITIAESTDATEVIQNAENYCFEKIRDMKSEIDRGYELPLTESELHTAEKELIRNGFILA